MNMAANSLLNNAFMKATCPAIQMSIEQRIELQKTLRECEKCIDVYCDKDKQFIQHWLDTFESDLQLIWSLRKEQITQKLLNIISNANGAIETLANI